MLKDEKIISLVEKKITFFPNEEYRALSNEIISYYHKYNSINIADFISYLSNNESLLKLFNEIMNARIKEKYTNEEIEDYIKVINDYPVKRKINELERQIKEETDPMKQAKILNEMLILKGVTQ